MDSNAHLNAFPIVIGAGQLKKYKWSVSQLIASFFFVVVSKKKTFPFRLWMKLGLPSHKSPQKELEMSSFQSIDEIRLYKVQKQILC